MDVVTEIARWLSPVRNPRLLDVGCGVGTLAGALARRPAIVTGVDPNPGSIMAARRSVPQAGFAVASAESLPFAARTFDGVVFVNSLHHVPEPRRALVEARRVSRPGSTVSVVEPLADGSFFEALRPLEDETEVRAAAQHALRKVVSDGDLVAVQGYVFERVDLFADVDAFLARVVSVDPLRAGTVEARRARVIETFERVAERDPAAGYRLRQPLRVDVLIRQ